jgi:hypothetical protein
MTPLREGELMEVIPERVDLTGGCLVFRTLKKRRQGLYRAVPGPRPPLDDVDPRAPRQEDPEHRRRVRRSLHNAALADASVCLHGNWSTPPSSACRAKSHRRSVKAVAI